MKDVAIVRFGVKRDRSLRQILACLEFDRKLFTPSQHRTRIVNARGKRMRQCKVGVQFNGLPIEGLRSSKILPRVFEESGKPFLRQLPRSQAFCRLAPRQRPFMRTLDLSRFDAAPLIAFTAPKETEYGTETDG